MEINEVRDVTDYNGLRRFYRLKRLVNNWIVAKYINKPEREQIAHQAALRQLFDPKLVYRMSDNELEMAGDITREHRDVVVWADFDRPEFKRLSNVVDLLVRAAHTKEKEFFTDMERFLAKKPHEKVFCHCMRSHHANA